MRTAPILLLVLAGIIPACAQPKAAEPAFDVASIKSSEPPNGGPVFTGMRGGPGSTDPTHATFTRYRLTSLISYGYDLKAYQLDRNDPKLQQEYDINVVIPEGASREQFRGMVRNLLAERFHLRAHFEKKSTDVYELVQAKGGHKLKPPTVPGEAKPFDGTFEKDETNLPKIAPGQTMQACNGTGCRMQRINTNLDMLITILASDLNAPIKDATGLADQKFDYLISYTSSAITRNTPVDAPAPLPSAINEQLGLRVERAKGEVDVLIVDSVDRQPTEN